MRQLNFEGWKIGFELEGTGTTFSHGTLRPVQMDTVIANPGDDGRQIKIEHEAGLNQFEIHTPVVSPASPETPSQFDEWGSTVAYFFSRRGISPHFGVRTPFWRDGGVSLTSIEDKPRYRAMVEAIDGLYEKGRAKRLFAHSAGHNALHAHFSHPELQPEDFFDEFGASFVNAFASRASVFAREAMQSFGDPCGVLVDYDRAHFWSIAPCRAPTSGPYDVQGLIERWLNLPRLIMPDGKGGWRVDLERPTGLEEVLANAYFGTVWEWVRPSPARPNTDGKPFTIEVRVWPSIRPEGIPWVLGQHIVPILREILAGRFALTA